MVDPPSPEAPPVASEAPGARVSSEVRSARPRAEPDPPEAPRCGRERPETLASNDASTAAAFVGRVLSGRYRIDALVAAGGMGAVYRGKHLLLHKRVAIKVLLPRTRAHPDLVERFEREAIAGAHVRHPNVAVATDFGELEDGARFLVLEYVRGRTLHEEIKRGPLEARRAAVIARQLASALEAVHLKGMVHRDVKPRNVMLIAGGEDTAKLIDFGLAKVRMDRLSTDEPPGPRHPSAPRLTGVGVVFGTLAYLAPEAAYGMDVVDERSDLYALGLILYEMLAGRRPFDAQTPEEFLDPAGKGPPPPIAARAPGVAVPSELEAVAVRMCERAPERRYQTAGEVIGALDAAALSAGLDLGPPATRTPLALAAPGVAAGEPAPEGDLVPPGASVQHLPAEPVESSPARPSPSRGALPYLVATASVLIGVLSAVAFGSRGPPLPEGPRTVATEVTAATGSDLARPPSDEPPPSTAQGGRAEAPAGPSPLSPAPSGRGADAEASSPRFAPVALRALLRRAAAAREWGNGEAPLLALVERDPAAFAEPEVGAAARDVATGVEERGSGDRVFSALTSRLGSDGLDVLYDIVQSRGRSRAARRAAELLRQGEVMARATPALRIAFELRDAPCEGKRALLGRASREGDGRALLDLQTLVKACFRQSEAVVRATRELAARLRAQRSPAP